MESQRPRAFRQEGAIVAVLLRSFLHANDRGRKELCRSSHADDNPRWMVARTREGREKPGRKTNKRYVLLRAHGGVEEPGPLYSSGDEVYPNEVLKSSANMNASG